MSAFEACFRSIALCRSGFDFLLPRNALQGFQVLYGKFILVLRLTVRYLGVIHVADAGETVIIVGAMIGKSLRRIVAGVAGDGVVDRKSGIFEKLLA